MARELRGVDLFCGAGGFSEGFRQAGVEIVSAVDSSPEACETYRLNHPDTQVLEADIRELSAEDLPDEIDVVLGSPPCTEFSSSKNGGNGDVEKGLELVYEFFRLILELDPDHWVMENVPRLHNHLDVPTKMEKIPGVEKDGSLTFRKQVLDASCFGTPQRRERLFSGEFPAPEARGDSSLSLGAILDALPSPLADPSKIDEIMDPLYELALEGEHLSDHFYNCFMKRRQTEEIRRRKVDHSYYGKMSFPDDRSRPARTILARNTRVARETIVVEEEAGPNGYDRHRTLTLREAATIQGFPITYQFEGPSLSKKWRLVGNAVPPPLGYAIAKSILEEEGMPPPSSVTFHTRAPSVDLNEDPPRRQFKLPLSRPFRHHVPYDSMQRFRVDLETINEPTLHHPLASYAGTDWRHPVLFRVVLYKGYAKSVESVSLPPARLVSLLSEAVKQHLSMSDVLADYVVDVPDSFEEDIPDATTLQAMRAYRGDEDDPVEFAWLDRIQGLVDSHLPEARYSTTSTHHPLLLGGTDLPIRTLSKALAASYIATKLNRCVGWIKTHPGQAFIPKGIDLSSSISEISSSLRCRDCIDERFRTLSENLSSADASSSKSAVVKMAPS